MSTGKKVIKLSDIDYMHDDVFKEKLESGCIFTKDVRESFTSGEYETRIFRKVISNEKALKRCLLLLHNSGIKANFSAYNFDYNCFKRATTAKIIFDNVDISTLDHNMILENIITKLHVDVLQQAIDNGVLEGVSVAKYVSLANSLNKVEHALLLANYCNGEDENDELSLDNDEVEDEWEYTITKKIGLQLTKYIGSSNSIVIPYEYKGKQVHGIKSTFLDDNSITMSSTPIVIYYNNPEIKDKEKFSKDERSYYFSIFYAMYVNREHVVAATNFSKEQVEFFRGRYMGTCIIKKDFKCCACCEKPPIIRGDWLVDSEDNSVILQYIGKDNISEIPKWATKLGREVFSFCTSLERVIVPDTITSIGEHAFNSCGALNRVDIMDMSAWCNISFDSMDANPLLYAHDLYLNGELVTNLEIPSSVTSIGRYAFFGCRSITSIALPSSVTSIGKDAFNGCSSLSSIVIPSSVTSIDSSAFYICRSLRSIVIPSSVTSIGEDAFWSCDSLIIYAEASSQPDSWNEDWNSSDRPVVWGYEETIDHTYTFNANGGTGNATVRATGIVELPTPTKEGWCFGGWYDNEELSGSPVFTCYYNKSDVTLYAKWLTEVEYYDGSSFERAKTINVGMPKTANIVNTDQKARYKFVPTESRAYTFTYSNYNGNGYYTTCQDTYLEIFDNKGNHIDSSYDKVYTIELEQDKTYYISVSWYDKIITGSFDIIIS